MKIINIEDALHREPFKSFLLRLENGKHIKVEHPELVLFTPSKANGFRGRGRTMFTSLTLNISGLKELNGQRNLLRLVFKKHHRCQQGNRTT